MGLHAARRSVDLHVHTVSVPAAHRDRLDNHDPLRWQAANQVRSFRDQPGPVLGRLLVADKEKRNRKDRAERSGSTIAAASGPIISTAPRPMRNPSSMTGRNGLRVQPEGGTVSMCAAKAIPPRGRPRLATSARLTTPAGSLQSTRSHSNLPSSASMRPTTARSQMADRLSIR